MKLFLLAAALVAATLAEKYTITVNTKDVHHAYTYTPVHAAAIDFKGNLIDFGVLNPGPDEKLYLEYSQNPQTFEFDNEIAFEKIGCLILRAGDDNAWLMESAKLTSETDTVGVFGENPDNNWLSTDTVQAEDHDSGHLAVMICDFDSTKSTSWS